MMQTRGRRKPKQKQRLAQLAETIIPRPPSLNDIAIKHPFRMRFISSSAANYQITYGNLLDSILVAATATAGYQLFDTVRIKRIRMWSWNSGGTATCTLQFAGMSTGSIGDSKIHTGTSMGQEPAYVSASPKRDSLASKFQKNGTEVAFLIWCPIATVIDLDLDFRNNFDAFAPVAVANALVSAQPGNIYFRGFDGLANASSKFVPQGTQQYV